MQTSLSKSVGMKEGHLRTPCMNHNSKGAAAHTGLRADVARVERASYANVVRAADDCARVPEDRQLVLARAQAHEVRVRLHLARGAHARGEGFEVYARGAARSHLHGVAPAQDCRHVARFRVER